MNTSNRTIRAARKAKAMRLQRWNRVPYHFSKWHYLGAKGKPSLVMSRQRKARFAAFDHNALMEIDSEIAA
jgi:hypothetical protein